MQETRVVIDASEAVARVAHLCSEVISIYPITPASNMGEFVDEWSARGMKNLWGAVPEVIEMQSEAGAAGALHGAVSRGALGTTFTASQGLLLMLPNMFKIAGELTPTVIHVAARTLATHALSIYGDHADVMTARPTGFAMLCASSVQEAADFAAVAHASTLAARIPFLHFFDGFRTSHELNTITQLTEDQIHSMLDEDAIARHRLAGLDPDRPVLRGSAQNPDVFFQAREACTPFHAAVPGVVAESFKKVEELTGRSYHLVDYHGAADAEHVVVIMGSGATTMRQAADALNAKGSKVGVLTVRLYRPFPSEAMVAALPATLKTLTVMDRCKEPGAPGDPLHLDVVCALNEDDTDHFTNGSPKLFPGRYGLSSKEFTPAMALAVFENAMSNGKRHFTVGIIDDVNHSSLEVDSSLETGFSTDDAPLRGVFFGLGSDGTVGANKNSAKIIGSTGKYSVQAYFVYDSKKSGSMTTSHVRADDKPIDSPYLIERATFVGVHNWSFMEKVDVLDVAAPGATVLLNAPFPAEKVWDKLPEEVQATIIGRGLKLYSIDAGKVASEAGMGGRINTIMQTCFFALTELLPVDEAISALKYAIEKTYSKRGPVIVERNMAVVDNSVANLHRIEVPVSVTADHRRPPAVPVEAPDFVQRVTAMMIAGKGDKLPVSALPPDGTFPTATAQWERRTIATEIPVWEPDLCIDCGKCTVVCPHAAIRMRVYEEPALAAAKAGDPDFPTKGFRDREHPGFNLTIGVAPDDCTGCGVCVNACPAHDKKETKRQAINMTPLQPRLELERDRWETFLKLPTAELTVWAPDNLKHSQVREPLFEFSGACSGCGETPYLKLITQLFGDHMIVANATGCSSIYGGNLPTTPYAVDKHGRGPAWSNSLFEDNAEFGLGIKLAVDTQQRTALQLLANLSAEIGDELVAGITAHVDDRDDAGISAQRERVATLLEKLELAPLKGDSRARMLHDLSSTLVRRSVWIVGGDGWAYDIGSGGLDHVLGSGRDVNIIVLDTEVYSNTGGQASKSTPRSAVAKFASAGKAGMKKDLGMEAITYGNVYVAQIAMGANDTQALKALQEAEAWPGVSLILAYSTCIAHGFDMSESMIQQKKAVQSGHWPLYRFRPSADAEAHPFQLDSKAPTISYADFAGSETRFAMLARSEPARASELANLAQADINERWRQYEQLASAARTEPGRLDEEPPSEAALARAAAPEAGV